MTEPDSVRYRQIAQIAVFGIRREVRGYTVENNKRQIHSIGLYSSFQKLPKLEPGVCAPYAVPVSDAVEMSYRGLAYDILEDQLPLSCASAIMLRSERKSLRRAMHSS